MITKLSNWLNSKARSQNLAEMKAALQELEADPQFKSEFQKLEFSDQWALARDMVNLQRGKYQEWRMLGVMFAAAATALWTLLAWWLGQ